MIVENKVLLAEAFKRKMLLQVLQKLYWTERMQKFKEKAM